MLYLARHGQSEANADGLLVGRLDSPLTSLGRRQASAIGVHLAAAILRAESGPPVRVMTSPLGRAVATAEIIAEALAANGHGNVVLAVDDRLIELDYGELDGLKAPQLSLEIWREWRANPSWRPAGGETLAEVADRVGDFCREMPAEHVVAVSHVSPIKAAVAWALGVDVGASWRMHLAVAAICRIEMVGGAPVLVSFNETGHLAGI